MILSVILMVVDHRYHHLDKLHEYLSLIVYPLQGLVDAPVRLGATLRQYTRSYQQLIAENQRLKEEQLIQKAHMQKYMSLEAENESLRTLLKASPRPGETLLVAEIIQVDSDPFIHRVVINKGSNQGVILGQPVIDATGVVGEVIEVHPNVSRVILLTDASNGIAVENIRNGIRGIVVGRGSIKTLELQHVPNTIDLELGDTLVTSGLDGRYPPGYPVGIISLVEHKPGESFASVQITPSARLERTRQVLLVQRDTDRNNKQTTAKRSADKPQNTAKPVAKKAEKVEDNDEDDDEDDDDDTEEDEGDED